MALALAINAKAEDYTLYYDLSSGATNNLVDEVDNLQRITFENGNIVITAKDGTKTTLTLSSVSRLFFSSTSSDIHQIQEDAVDNNSKEGVYDLTGRKLNVYTDTDKLERGIYIINGKKVYVK